MVAAPDHSGLNSMLSSKNWVLGSRLTWDNAFTLGYSIYTITMDDKNLITSLYHITP